MAEDGADAVSVAEDGTLRADCCDWRIETKWADTPMHRRLIEKAVRRHRSEGTHTKEVDRG